MDHLREIVGQIELHSVEGIRECFKNGVHPNDQFRGQPLIYELTSEYTRSSRFKECVKAFVDHGLVFPDNALLAVLQDDAAALNQLLSVDPGLLKKEYTLRCAYTPLYKVNLMHICAEFNHVDCAATLVEHGAGVNSLAGLDEFGLGGQTPIFHTVNQNSNRSFEMLNFLLQHSADLKHTVTGLIWGKGYEWETLIPAVNPVSYAMMGLLPQMHRNEHTITSIVSTLLKYSYGIDYTPRNVPCAYLRPSSPTT